MDFMTSLAQKTPVSCGDNDELDQKMAQVMNSWIQDVSLEKRQALLSSALDLFVLQFDKGSANGSQSKESESIEDVNTAQPLSDTASAKRPEPSCSEEKASCQEPESDVSCQSVLADSQPHTTRKVVDDLVKSNDQLRNEMVAASAGSKRKRKLSDDDNKNGHEVSSTSKRKRLEELNNAAVVSQPAAKKFDICPKTGRLIPRFNFVLMPDRVRRAHFKKQGSLLVQAVRRSMLQGRVNNSSCCFKRCFRRRPKL